MLRKLRELDSGIAKGCLFVVFVVLFADFADLRQTRRTGGTKLMMLSGGPGPVRLLSLPRLAPPRSI